MMSELSEKQIEIIRAAVSCEFLDWAEKVEFIDVVSGLQSINLIGAAFRDWDVDFMNGILINLDGE